MTNFIEGILSPLKTASSLLQEAIEIRDATKFRDTVGKLQTQILAAQQGALAANVAQAEMAEEISQLKGTSNNDDCFVGSIAGAARR